MYKVSDHELQERLFLGQDHGPIDGEELLLLYEEFLPKNPDFSYDNYGRLDFNDMNVWPILGLRRETYNFLLKHFKYRPGSHATNEVL